MLALFGFVGMNLGKLSNLIVKSLCAAQLDVAVGVGDDTLEVVAERVLVVWRWRERIILVL